MDDLVCRAMAKWPDVPAVFGWLRLDQRGRWWIAGEKVQNPAICQFIGRNYLADEQGRYLFQNGPQRVFVSIDIAPWVVALAHTGAQWVLSTHTGQPFPVPAAGLDESGNLLLQGPCGLGVMDERDLAQAGELITDLAGHIADPDQLAGWMSGDDTLALYLRGDGIGTLPLQRWPSDCMERRFGFVRRPLSEAG